MKRLMALVLAGFGLLFFHPNEAEAQTAIHGKYTLNVTIYLASTVPTGATVQCAFTIGTSDASGTNTETVSAAATVSTGQATCSLPIYYYWLLTTPLTDVLTVSYEVGILPSGATTAGQALRGGIHSLPPIDGVPASGTQSSLSVFTRL